LLEQALVEDQATRDATTNLTIDPVCAPRLHHRPPGHGRLPASARSRASLRSTPIRTRSSTRIPRRKPALKSSAIPKSSTACAHTGQVLAVIRHNARVLLSCERVILNLLQHLSGIATLTRKYVDAIQGTHARVLDTRKTVPGMSALEKYAVLCGGGTNHRIDLASGILIKNNHISLGGGIATVLSRALEQRPPGQRVQVEVRNAAGARRSPRPRRRSHPARQHDARSR
jgi:nicotinate-nucleotide pyrophosphorylase (carboxylating)